MIASRNFLLALAAVVIAPFVLLLLPGGAPGVPQTSAATMAPMAIAAEDAADHNGSFATVQGLVRGVHTARNGKATFIDLDGVYPDNPFTAVIFEDDMAKVGDVSELQGRTVDITGKIKLYRNKPEIVVSSRKQIVAR
ncbi:MAG TPA: hypothetical protein VIM56_15910 [Rhizomicrobium sp.]